MESGLWALATLSATALGLVAYNNPQSYQRYFAPAVPYVLGILVVGFGFYARWAELERSSVILGAGLILAAAIYLIILDNLDDWGVSRNKR